MVSNFCDSISKQIIPSDRRELPVDLRQKIMNGVLYIEPVEKATDSGTYTCSARNKQGQSARRSGEVFVIGMGISIFVAGRGLIKK